MKPPLERTHDISCVKFHVRDIETFGQTLTCATAAAFPNEVPGGGSRYDNVHVLLLNWEEDLLGVSVEIAELRDVFRNTYHYDTEEWHIPSNRSHNSLVKRITEFLEACEDRKNLLIVYYAGHGRLNDDRQLVGACHATPSSPTMKWLGIQNMLEQAESDVLILLDCCAGASSASEAGVGVTEVIAACGLETWAPGVSEHSFTRSLIDELQYWCGNNSNSVAMLHMRILATMKHWKPRSGRISNGERRKTPIHSLLTDQGHSRSIQLISLRLKPAVLAELPASLAERPSSESSSPHTLSPSVDDGMDLNSSQSSTSHVWSDPDFRAPKVLISLNLEEDQWLSPDAWAEWLGNIPAKVLLSIPVAAWDMMPEDPAVNFIGFVTSVNLLQSAPVEGLLGQWSTAGQAQTLPTSNHLLPSRVPKTEEAQRKRKSSWPAQSMINKPSHYTSQGGDMSNIDEASDVPTDSWLSTDFTSSKASARSRPVFAGTNVYGHHHLTTAPILPSETSDAKLRPSPPPLSASRNLSLLKPRYWTCGHCGAGLNSVEYNIACVSCGQRRDGYAKEH